MKRFRLVAMVVASLATLAAAAPLAGQGSGTTAAQPPADPNEDPDARWRRLQAEAAARTEAERAARQRYEDDVRESAEARARYEEGLRAHQAEVARLEAERAAYERRRAEYDREVAGREDGNRRERRRESASTGAGSATAAAGNATTNRCEARNARARRRGRGVGAIVGVGAGLLGRRAGAGAGLLAAALPVGAVLGEALVRLLDSCEQEQAVEATEEAVRGGVGTTATWTSETRPGVSGSSVVTAAATGSDGECLTVTDIVIVEGEETRADKRMCRRPPSNRYVRV